MDLLTGRDQLEVHKGSIKQASLYAEHLLNVPGFPSASHFGYQFACSPVASVGQDPQLLYEIK